jgi:hypothetical protein
MAVGNATQETLLSSTNFEMANRTTMAAVMAAAPKKVGKSHDSFQKGRVKARVNPKGTRIVFTLLLEDFPFLRSWVI